MYVGLDLSLQSSGMCRLWDSSIYETATTGDSELRGAARLDKIITDIHNFIHEPGEAIQLVAIEGYALKVPRAAGGKAHDRAELGGLVRWWLYRHNIPFIIVVPTSLKMFATGKGDSDKIAMCETSRELMGADFLRYNWSGANPKKGEPKPMPPGWGTKEAHWRDDENDAYWLANLAAAYNDDWDRTITVPMAQTIELIKADPQGTITADNRRRKADKNV
jgi:Holliday junction resolvasome RuvABC endonuclease subunit